MKVTDSGRIARDDNPLVGDGVALGVGDCDGRLIDAVGTGEVLAVGLGCEFPEAQPARTRIENAAAAPSLCRCAMTTSGSAGVEGAQSALDGTFEPDFQIRRPIDRNMCWPHLEMAETGDRDADADLNRQPSRGSY